MNSVELISIRYLLDVTMNMTMYAYTLVVLGYSYDELSYFFDHEIIERIERDTFIQRLV